MSKTHFKWRFKGNNTIHYAIDQDNEKTFIKNMKGRKNEIIKSYN